MTTLELRRVSKTFASTRINAVADVELQVGSGERLVLLGPSGAGKSTVLRLIAGLETPDTGDILFDDVSIVSKRPEQRGAVMVFQSLAPFPFRTVGENVAYGLKLRRVPKPERATRVQQALNAVQLPGFEKRWPDELSGGQLQRMALARAIVVEPKMLLLDEPLSSLDQELRRELQTTICDVQRSLGITTVLVTHDQEEARAVADRVAVMSDGQLQQTGTPDQIFQAPANDQVKRFIGW